MTTKQQIDHGDIETVCHLHNEICHSIHLCHTLPTLLYHLLCVMKSIKLWNEKNGKFLYTLLLQRNTLYQRR